MTSATYLNVVFRLYIFFSLLNVTSESGAGYLFLSEYSVSARTSIAPSSYRRVLPATLLQAPY
jgi:hypothetical protein